MCAVQCSARSGTGRSTRAGTCRAAIRAVRLAAPLQANATLRQRTQLREFVPQAGPSGRGGAAGKPAPKRPAGAITLRTLVDAGLLEPGNKVLYVEYKGAITYGDLTEEGHIFCQGERVEGRRHHGPRPVCVDGVRLQGPLFVSGV